MRKLILASSIVFAVLAVIVLAADTRILTNYNFMKNSIFNITNITATNFIGNGSLLTGITGGSGIQNYTRAATRVVCASNAKDTENCDYVCSGWNDDVTINNAISSISSSGGLVLLSDGVYFLNNPVNLTGYTQNIAIEGMGQGTQVSSFSTGYTFILGGFYNSLSNFYLQEATEEGLGTAISFGGDYNTVKDMIINYFNTSIEVKGLQASGTYNGHGKISDNTFTNSQIGVYYGGCTFQLAINSNKFYNTQTAIYMGGGNTTSTYWTGAFINNNIITEYPDMSQYLIYATNGDTASIIGNVMNGGTLGGVYLDGVSNANIQNNFISFCSGYCIYTNNNNYDNINGNSIILSIDSSVSIIMLNNTNNSIISGNVMSNSNYADGIVVSNSNYNTVLANRIVPGGESGRYAINFDGTSQENNEMGDVLVGNWLNYTVGCKYVNNSEALGETNNRCFNAISGSSFIGYSENYGWDFVLNDINLASLTSSVFNISTNISTNAYFIGNGSQLTDIYPYSNPFHFINASVDSNLNLMEYNITNVSTITILNPPVECPAGSYMTRFFGNSSICVSASAFNETYDAKISYNTSWNETRANALYGRLDLGNVSNNTLFFNSLPSTAYYTNCTNTSYMTSIYNTTYDKHFNTTAIANLIMGSYNISRTGLYCDTTKNSSGIVHWCDCKNDTHAWITITNSGIC